MLPGFWRASSIYQCSNFRYVLRCGLRDERHQMFDILVFHFFAIFFRLISLIMGFFANRNVPKKLVLHLLFLYIIYNILFYFTIYFL